MYFVFNINIVNETRVKRPCIDEKEENSINDGSDSETEVIGKSTDRNSVRNMRALVQCNDKINITEATRKIDVARIFTINEMSGANSDCLI